MRVQSIGTAVEPGYPTGDRFLGAARQVAFRKMDSVAEADDFSQEIGPMTEALRECRASSGGRISRATRRRPWQLRRWLARLR